MSELDLRRFSSFWLTLQASFMAAPSITNALILPILLPGAVAAVAGPLYRAAALGALGSCAAAIACAGPVLGLLADRMRSPCGRRRPCVLLGQLAVLGGIYLLMKDMKDMQDGGGGGGGEQLHHVGYPQLFAGYQLYSVGCLLSWITWRTILPEVVPEAQRPSAAAIQSGVALLCGMLGSGVGVLVGEGTLSSHRCYQLCMVAHALGLPLGWLVLGMEPSFGCAAEAAPAAAAAAATQPTLFAPWGGGGGAALTTSSQAPFPAAAASSSWWQQLRAFVSAFGAAAPFPWLFASEVAASTGGILQTSWTFYWLQDVVVYRSSSSSVTPPGGGGYTVLGHQLTSSPEAAMAVLAIVCAVGGAVGAVPGRRLGQRYGQRQVLQWGRALALLPPLLCALVTYLPSLEEEEGGGGAPAPAGWREARYGVAVLAHLMLGLAAGVQAPNHP
jgi:hypothetical protein